MNIFFDTEFIDTGREIHLLSIGLASHDGRTYYAEPADAPKHLACEWVQKNVLPHLTGPVKPRAHIRDEIVAFCGLRPTFWTYFGSYDWVVMCQLFGRMLDVPHHWPNFVMDIQQVRVEYGIGDLPKQIGVEHNALQDAIWTMNSYDYICRAMQREPA